MKLLISLIVFSFVCTTICTENYLGSFESESRLGQFSESAVSTDSSSCAQIGKNILLKNGTAADSIIAVLLCMGVTIPESMGLGGGCLIVYYDRNTRQSSFINARERAPNNVYPNFYATNQLLSRWGTQAIAVPGELAGYWHLHQKFGKIEWSELFDGAIQLSRYGFSIGNHLSNALKQGEDRMKNHPSLREIYFNKTTGHVLKEGDKLVQTNLSLILEKLANSSDPLKLFYWGDIAKAIIEDIKQQSIEWNTTAVITLEDFKYYSISNETLTTKVHLKRGNLTLHTSPIPGNGLLLAFIMKVMEKYDDLYPNASKTLEGTILFYHRLIETYKYAFSRRMLMGDNQFEDVMQVTHNLTSDEYITSIFNSINDSQTYDSYSHYGADVYIKEDHGTAHVSVVDKYGNAAAVTTTINLYFGSLVYSRQTGIILNDQMDDFSSNFTNTFGVPPSNHNLIEAGKHPLSSMCPSVFTDQTGKIRLVIGGSGGTKIPTAVALVSIRHLWFNETIKQAIDAPRVHHQLIPNEVVYETNFPKDVLLGLKHLGHSLRDLGLEERGAIVMAVSGSDKQLFANSDYRKGGAVDGL